MKYHWCQIGGRADLCETGRDGFISLRGNVRIFSLQISTHPFSQIYVCVDCGAGECFDDFRSHTHFSLDLQ